METTRITQRVGHLVGGLLLLTLVGCEGQSGSGGGSGGVSLEPTAAVTTAALLPGQTATLDILGVQTGIPMTVNPDGTVVATVGNLPVGTYTFRITYRLPSGGQDVTVAQASGTGNVVAGVTTTVSFTSLNTNFDDDGDSVTNLDEIRNETLPLDRFSRPTNAEVIAVSRNTFTSSLRALPSHSCARLFNGTVRCWGANTFGQLGNGTTRSASTPVLVSGIGGTPDTKARAVAVGGSHSCAVLENSTVQCWGSNDSGQLGNGTMTPDPNTPIPNPTPVPVTGITTATDVAVGDRHSCARLLNGTVQCWGANVSGQLGNGTQTIGNFDINTGLVTVVNPPTGLPVLVTGITNAMDVAAGRNHSCARLLTYNVQCWGANSDGQLGDGTNNPLSSIPVTVTDTTGNALLSTVSVVAAGGDHSCAVLSNGTVQCWGNNLFGQLGNGNTTTSSTPVTVAGITTVTAVAAGVTHSCAVLANGTVQCWGDNSSGQLGNETAPSPSTPVLVTGLSTATAVAVGGLHSCARLSTGNVRCWGDRGPGQLGDGLQTSSSIPGAKVSGLTAASVVAAGGSYSCALLPNTTVQCWGINLGVNGTTSSSIPVTVVADTTTNMPLTTATALATGRSHSCVVLPTGTLPSNVQCWGSNNLGQLGNNLTGVPSPPLPPSSIPVSVTGGITTAKAVAAGEFHSCALLVNGGVQCWGAYGNGQLGVSPPPPPPPLSSLFSSTPVFVTKLTGSPDDIPAMAIATGDNHSCAVLVNGAVQCWGSNASGQLGIPITTLFSFTPVPVTGITTATAVTTGQFHSCALLSTGNVQCWGDNRNGQLGNGTTTTSSTPVLVTGITTATAVSVGLIHSCAVLVSGTVQCWGANDSGQLGNGATTKSSSPVTVDGITTAMAVTTGFNHSCAVLSDKTVSCWGDNSLGQLGNGLETQSLVPVSVLGIP